MLYSDRFLERVQTLQTSNAELVLFSVDIDDKQRGKRRKSKQEHQRTEPFSASKKGESAAGGEISKNLASRVGEKTLK